MGFEEQRGTIQVISTSPKTEGELLDYYVSRHGMRESLTSRPTFRRLEPIDGPGRAVVLLTNTPPRSAQSEIDLSRVPAGTQTFITAEVSQSD